MSRIVPFVPAAQAPPGRLYTPCEAAHLMRVTTRTLIRWSDKGHLTEVRTLSGHRRYIAAEIERIRAEGARSHESG
ncbi:MAG TPA: MerR family DNA-binding transcriptional regulator [Streptosporangiaceae bacterium]